MKDTNEKIVYLVRHGESEGNISKSFQPPDTRLTSVGRKQAKKMAERLSKIYFDVLISSTLPRARETTEMIEKTVRKKAVFSDLFVERVKPSSLIGKSYGDTSTEEIHKRWQKSVFTSGVRVDDAENYDDLMNRADRILKYLFDRSEKVIVLVTHGFILKTVVARILLGDNLSPDAYKSFQDRCKTENTGITVIKYGRLSNLTDYGGNHWRLMIFNDHAHLG